MAVGTVATIMGRTSFPASDLRSPWTSADRMLMMSCRK